MAFDQGSYAKTQQDYNSALASLQNQGMQKLKASDAAIKAEHARLSKELDQMDSAAIANHERRAADAAASQQKNLQQTSATRLKNLGQGYKTVADGSRAYKADAEKYKQAVAMMRSANRAFFADMKLQGVSLFQTAGGDLDVGRFQAEDVTNRTQAIKTLSGRMGSMDKMSDDYATSKLLLDQMVEAHGVKLNLEKQEGHVIAQNARTRRTIFSDMKQHLRENREVYQEQLRMNMQLNQTLSRGIEHIKGGLVNALMVSSIALMSFGFKLQGVVDTFIQFEKELMNAQSIFQTTNDVLFSLSDEIVNFGTQYGISLGTASEGLYTLASAGLSAADSQEVLANTLKLSMAVQGDHDTIAKLTTQTIFGFGLEMQDSAALTDKFAHAINMSLIEYQDLASAVKFAMPFFVSTNQNIDQLLGSLQVLTNRALEAGIAGRGLRQALAEFAQHAQDSEAAFRKLGVEIMDSEGNFRMLTDIAMQFKQAMGPAASDVDLMTTLLEDLNVRGATAFVHLVQNAEEFQGAVDDLSNSAGSATRMADIQQQSLANQIQVVKNALMAPFLLSTEVGRAQGTMNEFGETLHGIVADFEAFFVTTLSDGNRVLTEQGAIVRDLVISALKELGALMKDLLNTFAAINSESEGFGMLLHALIMPVKLLVQAIGLLGEGVLEAVLMYKVFNMIIPMAELNTYALQLATLDLLDVEKDRQMTMKRTIGFQMLSQALLFGGMILMMKAEGPTRRLGEAMVFLAGAIAAVNVAMTLGATGGLLALVGIGGGLASLGLAKATQGLMKPPETFDMGGRMMYDTGGSLGGRHFPVLVEPGETIIPKTQNMLGGAGITLNIQGDIVTNDAEDFAERIAIALPNALRNINDTGGI